METTAAERGRRWPVVRVRTLATVVTTVAALAVPATAGAVTTLIGSGSSAAQPYMTALFREYSILHKNIRFKYTPDGGNAGVKDVQSGHSQFAINTRPPLPSDSGTSQFKLFLDGLCIDVNKSNSLSNISLTTLKNVFLGVDNNWGQVSGSNLSTTIDPIGRNSSAGQYTFFQSSVLGGATQSSNVLQDTSDGLVAVGVDKDANAIGYVGLAHASATSSNPSVKILSVNGIACDATNIKSETYPLFRFDWAVLPSKAPSAAAEVFLKWVATSAEAGKILKAVGAVPAFNK
jgi:phosphate transport system substrate-binding protein